MITYLINVNSCINMDFYDFFFYESEAERKVVIINVGDLGSSAKQMDELMLEMEERYFESREDYQIVFCIPRIIGSEADFTDNSDFLISYRIKKALRRYFKDYSRVYLFSFVYCPSDLGETFKNCNRAINDYFFCDSLSGDFPDFSSESVTVTKDNRERFYRDVADKIALCPNRDIREIFGALWDTIDYTMFERIDSLSEREAFYNHLHIELAKIPLSSSNIAYSPVFSDEIAGQRNLEIEASLKFIDYILRSKEHISQEALDKHAASFDRGKYAAVLSEYITRLNLRNKKNPGNRIFEFEYRSPEAALDACEEQYRLNNTEYYNAIEKTDTKIFTKSLSEVKGSDLKDDASWASTYTEILKKIDRADGKLSEYMNGMSSAFASSETVTEKVEVDTGNIESRLNDLEIKYRDANKRFLEICDISDVNYAETLKARGELSKLNRRIKNLIRFEQYRRIGSFAATIAFALLSVIIPYSIGETQVFGSFGSILIWLAVNLSFAAVMALGSAAVSVGFAMKKKKLLKEVVDTCDRYFGAYLVIASKYKEKLRLIAEIEKISTERDFIRRAEEEFLLYEKKLSYHKNRVSRLIKSLQYFKTLTNSTDSGDRTSSGQAPEINLDKDEKRNSFYYPKRASAVE